jgi:Tol biopolymer transport system component
MRIIRFSLLLCAGLIGLALLTGQLRDAPLLSFIALDENEGQRDIYLLDTRTGLLHNLTNNSYDEWSFAWSVDGNLLYSSTLQPGRGDALLLRDMAGQSVQQLEGDTLLSFNPAWSPDGESLVYVSSYPRNVSDIFLLDATTLQSQRLTDTPQRSETHPVWMPDGQSVLYVADGNLWQQAITETNGLNARQLTGARSTDSAPLPSPNGQSVAFMRTGSGLTGLYLLDVASGSERLLSETASADWPLTPQMAWFADNQTLLSGRGDGQLLRIDTRTGEMLFNEMPHARHYAAVPARAGETVAYIDGSERNLYLFDLSTAEQRRMTAGLRILPPLVWLP